MFVAGVVPTASEQNMKKLPYLNFFSFIAGVLDTGDQPLLSKISANFRKILKWPHWDTKGPGGNCFVNKSEIENLVPDSLPFKARRFPPRKFKSFVSIYECMCTACVYVNMVDCSLFSTLAVTVQCTVHMYVFMVVMRTMDVLFLGLHHACTEKSARAKAIGS